MDQDYLKDDSVWLLPKDVDMPRHTIPFKVEQICATENGYIVLYSIEAIWKFNYVVGVLK